VLLSKVCRYHVSANVLKELAWAASQGFSDFHNILQTDVSLTTFDASHEGSVNTSLVRKGLLRDSSG
jgi:hypothetical protein